MYEDFIGHAVDVQAVRQAVASTEAHREAVPGVQDHAVERRQAGGAGGLMIALFVCGLFVGAVALARRAQIVRRWDGGRSV